MSAGLALLLIAACQDESSAPPPLQCATDPSLAGLGEHTPASRLTAQRKESWRARIQAFLDRGTIPLVDLQSSLDRDHGERYLAEALWTMDELGIALIAFDGYEEPESPAGDVDRYNWGRYPREVADRYPDRFIPATDGGRSLNWRNGGEAFVAALETQLRGGAYPIIGELNFRQYMPAWRWRPGETGADHFADVPLMSANGQRVLALSAATLIALPAHIEPEDASIDDLEAALTAYPRAKIIATHFGQVRKPDRCTRFGPELVRRLLTTHPNLYYDLACSTPGHVHYDPAVFDAVIWKDGPDGGQLGELKQEYRALLAERSDRFVVGLDYGIGRSPLPHHLRGKAATIRTILRDLPESCRHAIGYRNAWFLLTGEAWIERGAEGAVAPEARN